MFDHYQSPLLLPGYEPEEEPQEDDRIDYALQGVSRFAVLFALGVAVTLLVRWLPALLPFYWIGAIACILSLALPAYLSRSARLLAIAIALIVAMFSGWFDALNHTTQQLNQQVQTQVEEVLK